MEIQVHQRNGSIKMNLKAEQPVINGDSEHLTNLVKICSTMQLNIRRESPEITSVQRMLKRALILTVEDKGIGMIKAVQSKIFERFYRQSSGNIHDVKGFGLGLNYSRAIIEAHKGTISVNQ